MNFNLGKNINIHFPYSIIFLLILIIDQVTKHLIKSFISPYKNLKIIPGFFNIVFLMNKGGAFGIFSDKSSVFRGLIFTSLSIITIIILVIIYIKSKQENLMRLGIVFLLGGAIGNLTDRLRWGMVVDFLDFYIGRLHWPAFNVADMAICIGLGLVFWNLIKGPSF